jgi:hypothetical protein
MGKLRNLLVNFRCWNYSLVPHFLEDSLQKLVRFIEYLPMESIICEDYLRFLKQALNVLY